MKRLDQVFVLQEQLAYVAARVARLERRGRVRKAQVYDRYLQSVAEILKRLDAEHVALPDVYLAMTGRQDCKKSELTRLGIALTTLGWVRRERRLESPRYIYVRPERVAPRDDVRS